jgi:hypothetical protein
MNELVIVAGFGRCGSSLMMQMLEAGGFPCVGRYPAFEDPESMVLNLRADWFQQHQGKAVKILDPHLAGDDLFPHIPRRVIWLDRDPKQQAKSFVKFGRMVGGLPFNRSDVGGIARNLQRDRPRAHRALRICQCNSIAATFEEMIKSPLIVATGIQLALGLAPFDPIAATRAVQPRSPNCLPYLLEAEQVQGVA